MESRYHVHEKGICESDQVGLGTRIWAFAHVLDGAVIGEGCNICDGAFVEGRVVIGDRVTVKNGVMLFDGAVLGDDVFVGPGVVLTNDRHPRSGLRQGDGHLLGIEIGAGATIGANSTVVAGTRIGRSAFVGAGSVVTRDVPDRGFVFGNPARRIGWACDCGHRLDEELSCGECGRRFREADLGPDSRSEPFVHETRDG